MRYRDVLKICFFDFATVREEYKIKCGSYHMRLDLVLKYIENQLLLLYPICPHFSEIVYRDLLLPHHPKRESMPKLISYAKWAEVDPKKIDTSILSANDYLKELMKRVRASIEKVNFKNKNKEEKAKFKKLTLVYKPQYYEWQK